MTLLSVQSSPPLKKYEEKTGQGAISKGKNMAKPIHGISDGIIYRPTREECQLNHEHPCSMCCTVQQRTCDEIDASMVEKAGT